MSIYKKSSNEKWLAGIDNSPVRLHPENPRYFLYDGKPVVLITATEHYGAVLNRNFDFVSYLDETADKKITLSRCFLLFRELEDMPKNPHSPCKPLPGEYIAPFLRIGPGYATDGYPKFDLRRWDPEFFERLHAFLDEAFHRGIIVELTLFSNTYRDPLWSLNPFNARNNINGVGGVIWQEYTTMLDPDMWELQQNYVRKIVKEVDRYNNIYFEVCNEPFADCGGRATMREVEKWQVAIRNVIREEEAKLPKQHLIFQEPIYRGHGCQLDALFDNKEVSAVNLHNAITWFDEKAYHLGGWMEYDLYLQSIHYLWTCWKQKAFKPLVMDEDNAASGYLNVKAWIVHRKRAWTIIFSGGHYDMIDFSIQCGGQERGTPESREKIRSWIKHLSEFIHTLDFVHSKALRDFPVAKPEGTNAATLAIGKGEWAIYLADSQEINVFEYGSPRSGKLVLPLPVGRYNAWLYSPERGEYTEDGIQLSSNGTATLMLKSFTHDIVLHVKHI